MKLCRCESVAVFVEHWCPPIIAWSCTGVCSPKPDTTELLCTLLGSTTLASCTLCCSLALSVGDSLL